ncbi:MAG: carboxylating nicotinate-nucleotide diphosphorylase [Candidatus Nanopelagicales bacterium]
MTTCSEALDAAHLNLPDIDALLERTLAEDLGGGVDVTTIATVPPEQRSTVMLAAREAGVICGSALAGRVFELLSSQVSVELLVPDGGAVSAGDGVARIAGPTHALLTGERTALNLLCHLSGVATLTARWVAAVAGTRARIRDTRKTTPGLRTLEKYAVRCGGGENHRMGLWDAALVKDNHIVAAGGVAEAFDAVREQFPGVPVEVEVDSLEQLETVVRAGADLVLLDNFTPEQTARAVALVAQRARLESSGGLTLQVAAQYAATGVDYLAVGALTHSAPILDLGADLLEPTP